MPNTNPNVATIQEMLRDLQKEVSAIPVMLSSFDARMVKLEGRMDKMDERSQWSLQWSNDEHAKILSSVTARMESIEQRLVDKLDSSALDLKNTEIRLNVKMDERSATASGRWLTIALTGGGWLLAALQFAIGLLHH